MVLLWLMSECSVVCAMAGHVIVTRCCGDIPAADGGM